MSVPEVPRGWDRAREELRMKFRTSLATTPPQGVNLSMPKHTTTTPCLRELVYDQSLRGKQIDVRWSDGSRSTFPCGVLPPLPPEAQPAKTVLRLGLMSFRHPELDYFVTLYACRNRELALCRSMAAEEEYSFRRSRAVLSDPALAGGALVEVYHTGLEPMVVGFYRGVASVLNDRNRCRAMRLLQIQPMLYSGKPEKENLSPESPGANPENYIRCDLWM